MHTDTITIEAGNIPSTDPGVLQRLDAEETGSEAMEYGALACGGIGITGLIFKLLNSEPVQQKLAGMLTGLLESLGGTLGGFFG